MPTSPQGLALIRHFEGFSATPYLCPAGYWTVGYGHVLAAHEPRKSISEAQAMALLRADIRHAEQSLAALVGVPLTQHQADALVSFIFNLGSGAFQRSTLRRMVNRGEHDAVPNELQRWVYAGSRKLPGLILRRHAEGRLYAGMPW